MKYIVLIKDIHLSINTVNLITKFYKDLICDSFESTNIFKQNENSLRFSTLFHCNQRYVN